MTDKENYLMDGLLGATQLHIEELDREIETIRTERLLQAAAPPRPALPQRARAGIGRRLIWLGVALVGEQQRRPARAAGIDGRA